MGGKSKQAQRTKNNSRPSNSGRSAELLGANIPSFVGFTTHSDFGFVPMTPGFSVIEALPDTFDANISPQYQVLLRKMSKKDPVTKVKALQEFSELISNADLEVIKSILPWWPKLYYNLANDTEHRVREATQTAQNAIVTKAGKNIAPYLKQLAPIWIASQYDNYAPAASIAVSSFKSCFSAGKVQEVFTFCQSEILDYITKNLTVHTVSTLCNAKTHTTEEAESKYGRIMVCSLQTYAMYFENVAADQIRDNESKIQIIFDNPKFWSFSKHKTPTIRVAWFQALSAALQHAAFLMDKYKEQIVSIIFKYMDENDPIVLMHVWTCILVMQNVFDDWYTFVNFKKTVIPKLFHILRKGGNGNAKIIHPHLLPFISSLSNNILENPDEFYTEFFQSMKESLMSEESSCVKSNVSAIVSSFYECIRYVVQSVHQKNTNIELSDKFVDSLLENHIIDLVRQNLFNDTPIFKYVFIHVSTLISYWAQNTSSSILYSTLVTRFWSSIQKEITEYFEKENINFNQSMKIIEFIQYLHNASPKLQDNRVKFSSDDVSKIETTAKSKQHEIILQNDLRELSCLLGKIYINKIGKTDEPMCVAELKILCEMFNDIEFYKQLSDDCNLTTTLTTLFRFFEDEKLASELIVDIIFDIIVLLEKDLRLEYINKLLMVPNKIIIQMVLQKLLSYPLCIEPEIRIVLAQEHVSNMILNIAKDVLIENSKEKFNLLHKCFFQTDSGDILIDKPTVDGIIKIMSEPLKNSNMVNMLDTCGSFIAQIMPVICSDNATKDLQNEIFLQLFEFSIYRTESDDLSEDTLWEITTCWQDALSSGDIVMNENLINKCNNITSERILLNTDLSFSNLNTIADMMAKLILCSTESIKNDEERYSKIDTMIEYFLNDPDQSKVTQNLIKYCSYFEFLKGLLTVKYLEDSMIDFSAIDIHNYFKKSYFNFATLFKLTCNIKSDRKKSIQSDEAEDEITEDYFDPTENLVKLWSDKIYNQVLNAMRSTGLGESLIANSSTITEETETLILSFTEKISILLKNITEATADSLKDKLYENVNADSISWGRAIPLLLHMSEDQDERNEVSLYEDLSNFVLRKGNLSCYINILQALSSIVPARNFKLINLNEDEDIVVKLVLIRCLITNNFTGDVNEISDVDIVSKCLHLLELCGNKLQDNKSIYNKNIADMPTENIVFMIELANLMSETLIYFPSALHYENFDVIIINLCSWVLNVFNNVQSYKVPKISIFIAALYKLHKALCNFVALEKTKSSTRALTKLVDDWNNLFSREVNLLLLKTFIAVVSSIENANNSYHGALLNVISPCVEKLNYSPNFNVCKTGLIVNVDEILRFALDNLSNIYHSVRIASLAIIHQLMNLYIKSDIDSLERRNELPEQTHRVESDKNEWHFLQKFTTHQLKYATLIGPYSQDFSYKLTEISSLEPIDEYKVFPYLFIWDCIILACSKAPAELKPIYAAWITENNIENMLLHFLFRAMPNEILKNYDSKMMNNDSFKPTEWAQIKDQSLSLERYACHTYTSMLRHLPAVVRRWWSTANPRQKTFIDKLTTNFVSSYICQEELRAISNKKEKYENMQVTVHSSTREVIATYSIDEARMELVIILAINHPLGPVKVESRKQIGGRLHSRTVVMQLTIFLTHQNGSIFDGLLLWKKNLDKKFEGVEECYICYSVIHQDTCQLPKSSCRACKKKFHGPCLYKWFTTSSKSTCPICRNIF